MKEGTTRTGFHFALEDDVMDNMELVEELAKLQDDDLAAITRITDMVLGQEQKKALYDHLRARDGRVKVSAVMDTMKEIFGAFGEQGKNC